MTRSHAFDCWKPTRRFERSFRKLGEQAKEQCKQALRLLIASPLSPGLRMKPIRPNNVYYEARTDSGDRLVLYPVSNTAHIMDVATHDEIAKWGNITAPELVDD